MTRRRINLLPPELAQRKRARQLLSTIGAAGIALVVLLAGVYGFQVARLAGERNRLEDQEDRNADLRAKIAELSEVDRLQRLLVQRTELMSTLTVDEVRWSVILGDISLVIPSDAWLTTFTGTVNAGGADVTDGTPVLGTLNMNGTTFSHTDVAKWLTRLAGVDSFTFPYLSLSAKAVIGDTPVVNFNSNVQLSEKAFRKNQRGGGRKI